MPMTMWTWLNVLLHTNPRLLDEHVYWSKHQRGKNKNVTAPSTFKPHTHWCSNTKFRTRTSSLWANVEFSSWIQHSVSISALMWSNVRIKRRKFASPVQFRVCQFCGDTNHEGNVSPISELPVMSEWPHIPCDSNTESPSCLIWFSF